MKLKDVPPFAMFRHVRDVAREGICMKLKQCVLVEDMKEACLLEREDILYVSLDLGEIYTDDENAEVELVEEV